MTSDDQNECPLCMEPFEVDDASFYPCTCGYQICRFCWHRLKTDGNGLCPACRKPYSENPAHFEPLSEDEIIRIKKERRHKEFQKKQKLTENRRHLTDVRVVQKNLVFVVGLSQRLADIDILKKLDYFGKFGKITKVVINSSPSYAGTQTPSASAYVTYSKPEEALKAIQTVNNVQIDNRTLKASLGTTKYCSHFLKGIQCQKLDCMYLHDLGEEAASFTKEEMSQGKHLEYESKLIESVLRNFQNASPDQSTQLSNNSLSCQLESSLITSSSISNNSYGVVCNNNLEKNETKSKSKLKCTNKTNKICNAQANQNNINLPNKISEIININEIESFDNKQSQLNSQTDSIDQLTFLNDHEKEINSENQTNAHLDDNLKINFIKEIENNNFDNFIDESEKCVSNIQEEDLGFDPWGESTKALQDLMKIEKFKTNEHLENTVLRNSLETNQNMESLKFIQQNLNASKNTELNEHQIEKSIMLENDRQHLQKYLLNNSQIFAPKLNNAQITKEQTNKIPSFYENNPSAIISKNLNFQELAQHIFHNNPISNSENQFERHINNQIFQNFNHDLNINNENYLNKIFMKTQVQRPIVPPPGFKDNNYNSRISASSSNNSSSSSSSSSVNNSNSTTPSFNSVTTKQETIYNFCNEMSKKNSNSSNLNIYNNENNLVKTPLDNLNSKNFQETFRSIFPNAHISFGYNPSFSKMPNFDSQLSNIHNNGQYLSEENSLKQSCWPDDPAIVSLNSSKEISNKNNQKVENQFETPFLSCSLVQSNINNTTTNNNNSQLETLMRKQHEQNFNDSLINQFHVLYQQNHLAFQNKQNEVSKINSDPNQNIQSTSLNIKNSQLSTLQQQIQQQNYIQQFIPNLAPGNSSSNL